MTTANQVQRVSTGGKHTKCDQECWADITNIQSNFCFSFETSDGISQQQKGELKDAGTEHAAIHYTGEYSYKDPKTGHTIKVVYTATDAGYHSQTTIE